MFFDIKNCVKNKFIIVNINSDETKKIDLNVN